MPTRERTDQKRRTRQDLLQAASRLMKSGRVPTVAEVAGEALISRATAYRYFSSDEALLLEATLHHLALVLALEQLFADDPSINPEERLLKADAAVHGFVWDNQIQLRLMLALLLEQAARANGVPAEPLRVNRRMGLIEAALAPARDQFDDGVYQKLCASLALIIGTESMVVFRDVLQMDDPTASEVESWVVRVLTRAALSESNLAESKLAESNPSGRGKPRRQPPRKTSQLTSAKRKPAK